MKPLIRDYLASLKEREELDAILPDLLSELGYTVISRPRRGTTQRGVDVAAVGMDGGEQKLFLFSVKPGDLTRSGWNGPDEQALRPSLDEILDGYLLAKVPPRYRNLRVVVCLCIGGEIREEIRDLVVGYTTKRTTDRISFDEWNGDRMAGLLLTGILREEVLPRHMRSSFQKSIAMLDEPEIAYRHFLDLARLLYVAGQPNLRSRLRAARQLCLCAWIAFVWARDIGNVEAAYKISELAVLYGWEFRRTSLRARSSAARALHRVVLQMIDLHIRVGSELFDAKILPHASVRDGLSMAVRSDTSLDVNLALFEILGRLGLMVVWVHWIATLGGREASSDELAEIRKLVRTGFDIIEHNHLLLLPIADHQATDVGVFLRAWLVGREEGERLGRWFSHMANRLVFTLRTQGRYPTVLTDYRDLAEHPKERSDAYFREATSGSTLIPLLAPWLAELGISEDLTMLSEVVSDLLKHCTLQLWTPDEESEAHIYVNDAPHGIALSDLTLDSSGVEPLTTIRAMTERSGAINDLSAVRAGFWPIILLACRHYRLPIPPRFWVEALQFAAPEVRANGQTAK